MKIDQIEELISSKQFQQLKYFQEKTNVFTIVGQTHTEHWHSAFMSWLLDPNSSLCLGHYPIVRLLSLYMAKNENSEITLKSIYDMDLDSMHFQREKTFFSSDQKKRSIDVFGESDELILVIENKVKAKENMNGTEIGQTKDYRDYMESHKKDGQKVICLFITPDSKQKPFDKSYTQITYQELYDYVIAKCLEHPQLNEQGRYVLEQYANNLRETVNGSPMALVNVALCNEIYDLYSQTLDEIFTDVEESGDYLNDDKLSCIAYSRYSNVFDEIYLSLEGKNYGRTPKSNVRRNVVTFTDLYNANKVKHGMELFMEYAGNRHYALVDFDEAEGECYLLLLDDEKKPYFNKNGEKIGYYKTSSQAAVDAVNIYRKKNNIDSRVSSLSGPSYWKTKDGTTVKEMMDSL